MMKRTYFLVAVFTMLTCACTKDYLDKKPNQALLVPTTLSDLQALLDNVTVININPSLNIIAGDEYTVSNNGTGLNTLQANAYYWADDVYDGNAAIGDWDTPYRQIFYANIVLDALGKLDPADDPKTFHGVKGSALFIRAYAAYNLLQLFAQPYAPATSTALPGLPIFQTSNVNQRPGRGTLQGSYEQVLTDLKASEALLPLSVPVKSRPNKAAALALLARTSLTMQDYEAAGNYAEACLQLNNKLIDYNSLSLTAANPFPLVLPNGNDEVLYNSDNIAYAFVRSTLVRFSEDLLSSYQPNDLRRSLYFIPANGRFRGYTGLATDEQYLIRAECEARRHRTEAANQVLNTLLIKRFRSGTYVPFNISDEEVLLKTILLERKKELVARGLRWTDLRRLNQAPSTAVTLKRVRDGKEILLTPNGPRYTFPIPLTELGPNIPQNPR